MLIFWGSIPFGLIIAKIAGVGDIRQQGSGNIGATNMARIAGKKLGFLTLLFDALKGIIAIKLASTYSTNHQLILYSALAVIFGHIFPVWLNFKGGKGVATSLAVILTLNIKIGIFICLVWILVFVVTKNFIDIFNS